MYKSQPIRHRFFALSLLVLFSYNAVCCHISLWLWKAYMQEQLEEFANTLSNEELVHFVLPNTTGIEHEIELNGHMYDVIRYEQNETSTHYWCIQDFAESIMSTEESSDDLLADAHQQWKDHLKTMSKKTTPLFCSCTDLTEIYSFEKHLFVSSYFKQLQSKRVSIQSPPPWLWFV